MSRTILLVDDDAAQLDMFASLLRVGGYDVCTASGGEDAFSRLRQEVPDLVVTDLQMPPGEWGGIWLVRKIALHHPEVPVVIMSERGSIRQAVEAVKLGAKEYVEKADAATELCTVIDDILVSAPRHTKPSLTATTVLGKILDLERQLRILIRDEYDRAFPDGHEWRIRQLLSEADLCAIEGRMRHRSNEHSESAVAIADFTYLDQLRQLMNREWRLFSSRMDDKQRFNLRMDTLVPIRNELAHVRTVSELDLRKADVFCDELLSMVRRG